MASPTPRPGLGASRRSVVPLLALWMVSFGLRAAVVFELRSYPLASADLPPWDDYFFVNAAWSLVSGDSRNGEDLSFVSAPPYVAFLAACFAVFGREIVATKLVQAGLGACIPLLVVGIGAKVFSARAAWISGALAAVYPLFLFYDALLVSATLATLLLTLAVWLLLRAPIAGFPTALAAGTVLGLGLLIRFNLAIFLPVAAGWLAASGGSRRGRSIAGLLLGAAVVVVPYLARDALLPADHGLFAHGAGIHFYIGNHGAANGTYTRVAGVPSTARGHVVGARSVATAASGRVLGAAEVSSWWLDRGLRFVREEPGSFAGLCLRKLRLFGNAYEIPNLENFYFAQRYSRVLRHAAPGFAIVAPLGVLGLLLGLGRRPGAGLLGLYLLCVAVSLIPLFVTARYRLPAAPALVVCAGHGLAWLFERARARDLPRLARPLLALCAFLAVVNAPPTLDTERFMAHAESQLRVATELPVVEGMSFDRAGAARALRLGKEHLEAGRISEAQRLLEWAAQLAPEDPEVAEWLDRARAEESAP